MRDAHVLKGSKDGLTVEELALIFSKADPELVLIGEQAVAFWAEEYAAELGLRRAIAGEEIELWGDRALVTKLARDLNVEAEYRDQHFMSALTGTIRVRAFDRIIKIAVFHHVPGVEEVDRNRVALPVAFGDCSLMVLDPIALIGSRLHSVQHSGQREGKHSNQLELLMRISRLFIGDVFRESVRIGLIQCRRVIEIARRAVNQQTSRKYSLGIFEAVPIETIRTLRNSKEVLPADREKLDRFIEIHWERLGTSLTMEDTRIP